MRIDVRMHFVVMRIDVKVHFVVIRIDVRVHFVVIRVDVRLYFVVIRIDVRVHLTVIRIDVRVLIIADECDQTSLSLWIGLALVSFVCSGDVLTSMFPMGAVTMLIVDVVDVYNVNGTSGCCDYV